MPNRLFLFCLFLKFIFTTDGFSLPVDISLLVADVKYSKEKGIQICEIQHGTDSVFKGEVFANGGFSNIADQFVNFFSSYHQPAWFVSFGINDKHLKNQLVQNSWKRAFSLKNLFLDKEFKINCTQTVSDPESIRSYQGFVFAESGLIQLLSQIDYSSSVILIDQAMLPVWKDKYKVSLYFKDDTLLEACKPRWNLYEKKYSTNLADHIINELDAKRFVIKPRDKFCGNGVILVDKENLDSTLKYIFSKSKKLKNDSDRAYRSWYDNNSDTFLVEEFVPSDPVLVPHLGMKPYCPTLRIVFLAVYDQGEAEIHFLGGYHCLPEKPLSGAGSLHQKYKTSLETVHSSVIEQDMYEQVINELYEPLLRFYKRVLNSTKYLEE